MHNNRYTKPLAKAFVLAVAFSATPALLRAQFDFTVAGRQV
jgi:hypothetical protein